MPQRRAPSILMVAESRIIHSVIRIYLAGEPYEFVAASQAATAQVLRTRDVSLIIADVTTPGEGGFGLLRTVRADSRPRVRALPVIVLLSERGDTVRGRAIEAGASAVLMKPLSGDGVLEVVRRHVRPAVAS